MIPGCICSAGKRQADPASCKIFMKNVRGTGRATSRQPAGNGTLPTPRNGIQSGREWEQAFGCDLRIMAFFVWLRRFGSFAAAYGEGLFERKARLEFRLAMSIPAPVISRARRDRMIAPGKPGKRNRNGRRLTEGAMRAILEPEIIQREGGTEYGIRHQKDHPPGGGADRF